MANTITIIQLAAILKRQIAKGNGDKKILISNDDEGNGYHELFFGCSPIEGEMKDYLLDASYMLPFGVNEDNIEEYAIIG